MHFDGCAYNQLKWAYMVRSATQKKSGVADALLKILAGALILILLVLPVHAFVSTWGGTAIGPLLVWKSWKEILIAALVPLVVWLCFIRPDIAKQVWSRWYNKVIAGFAVLVTAASVFSAASGEAVVAGFLIDLRFLAVFVLAQVIMASGAPWVERLKTWVLRWLVATGVFLAVLAILQVTVVPKDFLVQFGYDKDATISPYLLVDQHPDALRAFATMRGPNTLAAYLLLPLAAALVMWWQNRKRWWAVGASVLMLVAIFLSHSRSGWLGALAMLATLAFVTLPRETLIKWLKFGTVPAILLAALVLWLATTIPDVRLAVFHSGGNDPAESLLEGSSDQHWQSTFKGIAAIAENPLGTGVGTAGPASFYNTNATPEIPENYFVQIGQEVGVVGLGLFIAASIAVWQALWRRRSDMLACALLASFIGINVINIFLHGWADDPTAMTWWAIAGLMVGARKTKIVQSK
jgi:hypothetical protein